MFYIVFAVFGTFVFFERQSAPTSSVSRPTCLEFGATCSWQLHTLGSDVSGGRTSEVIMLNYVDDRNDVRCNRIMDDRHGSGTQAGPMNSAAVMQGDFTRILPPAESCVYTKCYCEENVWQLCKHIQEHSPDEICRSYAVFLSNKNKQVPLWMQRSAESPDKPVVWDYHVIFVYQHPSGTLVYDLDTRLPFPVSFDDYIAKAIGSDDYIYRQFHRWFRVISAADYLRTFASDRSHMKKPTGEWYFPPPDYPCITSEDGTTMNLDSFISMAPGIGHGEVMKLKDFRSKFTEVPAVPNT